MTSKQITAFVFSICVTVIALLYLCFAIGMVVSMGDVFDGADNVVDEHGGLGALALVGYMLAGGVGLILCYAGMLLHSLVGLITACASLGAKPRGAKITSVVLIVLNGILIAMTVIPLLISILI